jgi:hypothetical protein
MCVRECAYVCLLTLLRISRATLRILGGGYTVRAMQ